ncbi:DUF397 domain-containing protein [Amycolatopsis rhabdoformis]|uniref:DUF397 domain-containing protein n=1 Tax=Amycolatopsis rhabdoformis TaxID=1448059 RepID=A0ABZ1HWS8_9PSEU|nr:DUF397 domain-containing protein [Amycolatopsis rhabdoformis]WSE25991.1 DUF397 domain-containing protein [Amycolatopsis rhabdoformis]
MTEPGRVGGWRTSSYSTEGQDCVEVNMPASVGEWRKSTFSGQGQDCVEVKIDRVIGVRDTKDRAGGELAVAGAAWRALTEKIVRD